MQKEITDQYQHHYVYQLEKQTAGTYTDQNINSFDGRRIKSFQYQLFPQAEKCKRNAKQGGKQYRKS